MPQRKNGKGNKLTLTIRKNKKNSMGKILDLFMLLVAIGMVGFSSQLMIRAIANGNDFMMLLFVTLVVTSLWWVKVSWKELTKKKRINTHRRGKVY